MINEFCVVFTFLGKAMFLANVDWKQCRPKNAKTSPGHCPCCSFLYPFIVADSWSSAFRNVMFLWNNNWKHFFLGVDMTETMSARPRSTRLKQGRHDRNEIARVQTGNEKFLSIGGRLLFVIYYFCKNNWKHQTSRTLKVEKSFFVSTVVDSWSETSAFRRIRVEKTKHKNITKCFSYNSWHDNSRRCHSSLCTSLFGAAPYKKHFS